MPLTSGHTVAVQALAVMPRYTARGDVLTELGLPTVAHPTGVGTHLATDPTGLTAVAGVWAAGNVADLTAGVIHAATAGDRERAVELRHHVSQLTVDVPSEVCPPGEVTRVLPSPF